MLDLGHLGGWAAGGPVAEAVTPATNTPAGTAAPADADAAALAASFGALIDDIAAGGAPAAIDVIGANAENLSIDANGSFDAINAINGIDAGDAGSDKAPVEQAGVRPQLLWLQGLAPADAGRAQVTIEKKSAGRPDQDLVLPQDTVDDAERDDSLPMLIAAPLPIAVTPLPTAVIPPAIAATPSATTQIDAAPTVQAAPEMSQPMPAAPDATIATDAAPATGGEAVARAVSFKPEVIAQSMDAVTLPGMDVAELPVVDVAKFAARFSDEPVHPADKRDRSVAAVAQYAGATGAMAREIAAHNHDMTGDRQQPQPDQSSRGLGARAWGHVAARYRAESVSRSDSASTSAASEDSTAATLTIVPPAWTPIASAPSLVVPARLDRTAEYPAETLPEGSAQQIVHSLRVVLSRGGGDAHIRLDPHQFGDLSVSIRVDGGHVVAQLQAETPAVREWLHANQQTLRQGLAEQDLRLERLEILAPADETRDEANRDRREQQQDPDDHPAHRMRRRETGGQFEFVA